MANKLTARTSIRINAPVSEVWKALTDPAMIKQYLFGTETITDWKKGSAITYNGIWNGKPYQDRGRIMEIVPQQLLHTTYLSGNSGKEDKPENYNNVIYELKGDGKTTEVTLTQDNIASDAELEHMKQNWNTVLAGMKKAVEK